MYKKECGIGKDPVDWVLMQLDKISNTRPRAIVFMRYIKDVWRPKMSMWCVGARQIYHAKQNTNVALEFYHSNFMSILNLVKDRYVGWQMNCLIQHLMSDVITHYQYIVQCKAFGSISNMKQEGIFVSTITIIDAKLDTNVLICMDEGCCICWV